jgi:hypoxia up-regulated 1
MPTKLLTALAIVILSTANVVGIDLGNDVFTITLVKPGQPFDIVENPSSDRKTSTAIAIQKERTYGANALRARKRSPGEVVYNFADLIGELYNSTTFQNKIKSRYLYKLNITEDPLTESPLIYFPAYQNISFYFEEVLAMVLKFGKAISEKKAHSEIKDCVLTVPPFFNDAQKQMMLNIVQIAELKPLALISENTAASLKYAIDWSHSNISETIMYLNLGATSYKVSLIKHYSILNHQNKSEEIVEVLAEAWNQYFGGSNFDQALVDLMADTFDKSPNRVGKPSVKTQWSAYEQIITLGKKIKEKLTANKEVKASLDDFMDHQDLKMTISRSDFEAKATPLLAELYPTIEEVLSKASLNYSDITTVELLGHGNRIPLVMQALADYFAGHNVTINRRLNSDEAISFGAAFLAANLSHLFKTKPISLIQRIHSPVKILMSDLHDNVGDTCLQNKSSGVCEGVFFKEAQLFDNHTKYDIVKSISFNHEKDLFFRLKVKENDEYKDLVSYEISGISNIKERYPNMLNQTPKVKIMIETTNSGIVKLASATANIMINEERVVPLKNITNSTNETTPVSTFVEVAETVELIVKEIRAYPKNWNSTTLENAKRKLKKLEEYDEQIKKLSESKNKLEENIYNSKDWLSNDANNKYVTKDELSIMNSFIEEVENWALENSESEVLSEFKEKNLLFDEKMNKFKLRKQEYEIREEIMQSIDLYFKDVTKAIDHINATMYWVDKERLSNFSKDLSEV